jgi:hypothetical protein
VSACRQLLQGGHAAAGAVRDAAAAGAAVLLGAPRRRARPPEDAQVPLAGRHAHLLLLRLTAPQAQQVLQSNGQATVPMLRMAVCLEMIMLYSQSFLHAVLSSPSSVAQAFLQGVRPGTGVC